MKPLENSRDEVAKRPRVTEAERSAASVAKERDFTRRREAGESSKSEAFGRSGSFAGARS
jgi:hypothetical protein